MSLGKHHAHPASCLQPESQSACKSPSVSHSTPYCCTQQAAWQPPLGIATSTDLPVKQLCLPYIDPPVAQPCCNPHVAFSESTNCTSLPTFTCGLTVICLLVAAACRGSEAGSKGFTARQGRPHTVSNRLWQDTGFPAAASVGAAVSPRCVPR